MRLDEWTIKKIQDYPEEVTNVDVGKELWIDRRTVAKYRKGIGEVLEWKKEEKLSKQQQKKLDLLEHYSEKEIKEMLAQ